MKNILTGNEAIEVYESIQSAYSPPNACGYFISDDCEITSKIYDSATVVAFDSTNGGFYDDGFSTIDEAIEWISK